MSLSAGIAATANAATDKKETTKKSWTIDASHGTYGDRIPIEVPAFRGITPELALTYDSSGENGESGVGWSLDGAGVVERASPGKGAPNYDATDIFLLDGKEMVACAPGSVSPSCTTGGTHSTKVENYERIALSGTGVDSRWTITAKDGVRRVYAPVFTVGGTDVFRWGLEQVIDTMGNVVTYDWGVDQFGCCWEHLNSVSYNGTTVTFHYETRPDLERAAVGKGTMRTGQGRLKTVDVAVSGSRLRAYKLSYTESAVTSPARASRSTVIVRRASSAVVSRACSRPTRRSGP
ncbi:SpvB/TcaC N-terminal domain-containing protein [Nannocystis punicea]|uniref:SpvB/TcaC N-terminal domain-containing protein n=1 Tax=Nannocystis punicea TaxID=2995304 RepID=A0ABY7GUB1_9BACT|nr:SpvB/TcaC N-terminal domain-containing protein [Nannocystis poenicansa]WAS90514.1 SpvB/TcaC N-terminal domain-containing protein [Nannocystis poenicansa]